MCPNKRKTAEKEQNRKTHAAKSVKIPVKGQRKR